MKMTRSLPRLVLLSLALVAAVTLLAPEWSTEGDSSSLSLLPSARVVSAVGKKLTEKQLQDIEDQWMEDEEEDEDDTPFKYRRTPDGGRLPPQPNGPKTEMGFVTIKGVADKKATDLIAGRWTDVTQHANKQMMTAGIDVRGYTIDSNRILFVCDTRGFKDMVRVRQFVLSQPEAVEFDWNNKKSLPGDVAAEDESGMPSDPVARFQAMQDEQMARQKREAKKKKREAERRKRQKEREKKKKMAERKKKQAEAAAKKKAEAEKQAAAQQTQQPTPKTEL